MRLVLCRDVSIRQLEQKAGVLEKAKEATERRLRNDLAAERRQQADLKQQMKQLQVGCSACMPAPAPVGLLCQTMLQPAQVK